MTAHSGVLTSVFTASVSFLAPDPFVSLVIPYLVSICSKFFVYNNIVTNRDFKASINFSQLLFGDSMTNERIRQIKKIALAAMFADDVLMEKLVLKGGNLLDLVYDISVRASVDLDLSIDGDFDEPLDKLKLRVESALKRTFKTNGYEVIDVSLKAVPKTLSDDRADFWGGYELEFKVLTEQTFNENAGDLNKLRMLAIPIGDAGATTKIKIDLSKHEYCQNKKAFVLDDLTIFAYAPETFVCEKLRAICQQMQEYVEVMQSNPSSRARDFLDLHLVCSRCTVSFTATEFQTVLAGVFSKKQVPLHLIDCIKNEREFHRSDFDSVKATVRAGDDLKSYDYYFDFVVSQCELLNSFWDK